MTAALNQFISWLADKCWPFFLLMNKWKEFEWTEECALTFQQLKEYLSWPLIMSSPKVDEVLFAYVAVALQAVSLVLVWVDSGVQRPVYYVSKSLRVHATRKLSHYFQSHIIVVLTQLPLRSLFQSAGYMGRIAKWGTILGAFDNTYLALLSRVRSSQIWWPSSLNPRWRKR